MAYHDDEWGRPVHGDAPLFERISLEAFQSGLSWITILRKREAFRAAFAGFDPAAVAAFDDGDVERLMADAGIVRNRLKVAGDHRQRARPWSRWTAAWTRCSGRSRRAATGRHPRPRADVAGGHAGVDGDGEGVEAQRVPLRRARPRRTP